MLLARAMNWRSISSVAMKSAITPSRIGRMISTGSGVLALHGLGVSPTASTSRWPPRTCTATMDGSSMMMPRPDHVHQRVRGAEVDGDVVGECARYARKHGCHCMKSPPRCLGAARWAGSRLPPDPWPAPPLSQMG